MFLEKKSLLIFVSLKLIINSIIAFKSLILTKHSEKKSVILFNDSFF